MDEYAKIMNMSTRDESDNESDAYKLNNQSYVSNGSASSPNTSRNSSGNGNWYRWMPRRIRRFIDKQSHRQSNQSNKQSNLQTNKETSETSTENEFSTNLSEGDATDETHLYSTVDYSSNDEEVAMIKACSQMARYGWFWGPISRHTAQQRLHGTPNGSFLVRNSQINLHNFTISFRTAGKTLHYRIEFVDGYWQTFSSKHRSIVDLIDDAMKKSKENVFCYVKQSSQLIPPFPVRLTNPISHFGDISSLQNMCRLVIQKSVDIGKMDLLPLPNILITYLSSTDSIYGEMPFMHNL